MKDSENVRGNSEAPPDHFFIREYEGKDTHADSHRVDRTEASEYRHFMSEEADVSTMPKPWRPLDIDPKMRYKRERSKYLVSGVTR